MILRPATPEDDDRILAWNEADVHFLAPMDPARLAYLRERASGVEIIDVGGTAAGFVITFVEGSGYDSENYAWFSERESRFHYVDRIVIDPLHRGQGLARGVYAALAARFPDRPLLAEVNYAPPNPTSLAFHRAFGFEEVGRLGDRAYGVVLLSFPTTNARVGLL
jgi:uncharacterized protein